MLKPGLYEHVINQMIQEELSISSEWVSSKEKIDRAEASIVLSQYLGKVIEKGLRTVDQSSQDIGSQVELANKILELVRHEAGDSAFDGLSITQSAEQLMAVANRQADPSSFNSLPLPRPESSLSRSSLMTGSRHEPSMVSELQKEIQTSNRIDMLVSFIKWSGLRLILEELKAFTQRGGLLRIITTSYMGATDLKAIQELSELTNTEIRVSYDTKWTRLHAKAYVFYRESGYSVAYIGSSNLSRAAIVSGLEWNVKVTGQDLPETLRKIEATFTGYWNSSEFEFYDKNHPERLRDALAKEDSTSEVDGLSHLFDIKPYTFQQEILDSLEAERTVRGHYRNLVVAATGTGKTVISAFDYLRFRNRNRGKSSNLLFIAHREEILKQSLSCFRGVLKDPNFGELYVGNHRAQQHTHLFMSIQTFNSTQWQERTSSDYYDYIVVDEFHHAAAPSYNTLLTYYQPQILLGLTATPERMDGKDILDHFDQRIASEIRLPEAIERGLLSPFQYFGVSDDADLSTLRWTRGGYDRSELSNLFTINRAVAQKRASLIIQSLDRYVTDMNEVIGLGFCVSVEHAAFMADSFNRSGIPSLALTGGSSNEERSTAQSRLISGELRFIFVVDLYNEGVDIPDVNTVLFLRPTESLTVFLQQLGRGLRLAEGKDCLTVLDFIGQSNTRYNFEERFEALLTNTRKGVRKEIETGFASLPHGSYIKLEKQAEKHILDNISSSFDRITGLVQKLTYFAEDSPEVPGLRRFLEYYHLNPKKLYQRSSFAALSARAGLTEGYHDPQEDNLRKGLLRICDIDSRDWIEFLESTFDNLDILNPAGLSESQSRMLGMFRYTMWPNNWQFYGFGDLMEALQYLKQSRLYPEFRELLTYNYEHIDFVDKPLAISDEAPLALHCRYTKSQIWMSLGFDKPNTSHREGVYHYREKRTDIFFITLNKSDKDYSPTTMYEDYSINDVLFHWQSQSTTSEESETGQRYIHHARNDHRIMLFVREFKNEFGQASPYTLLGFADYVTHEGSRPMSIVWRLHDAIPGRFLKQTNQLDAG